MLSFPDLHWGGKNIRAVEYNRPSLNLTDGLSVVVGTEKKAGAVPG